MKTFIFASDIATIVFAILSFVLASKLVLRTEKELDKAMKFFLLAASVLLLASLAQLNKYFGTHSDNFSLVVCQVSRAAALLAFFLGLLEMLKMINKISKK